MINEPITVQNLRRKIYIKAKAEPEWRFWGLYVHICKLEVLQESYRLARLNNGAPGIDKVSFYQIEEYGVDKYLREIQSELVSKSYYPLRNRLKEIPKAHGTRTLGIPTVRNNYAHIQPLFGMGNNHPSVSSSERPTIRNIIN